MRAYLGFGLVVVGVLVLPPAAQAALTYGTIYNSGNIAVVHGSAQGFPCAGGGVCSLSTQTKNIATGFDNANIWITGFRARYTQAGAPQDVRILRLDLNDGTYNNATGDYQWSFTGEMRASSTGTEPWEMDFNFVLVLTKEPAMSPQVHMQESTAPTCAGGSTDTCSSSTTMTGAKPSGMDFAGIAIRSFAIERTDSTPGIQIHRMGVDVSSYSISGSDASLTYSCAFGDATPSGESMDCAIEVVSLAAVTGESDNFSLSTTDSGLTSFFGSASSDSAGAVNIDGGLGGLAGWDLSYDNNGAHKLWRCDAGYTDISVTLGGTDFFNYTRKGLLGDVWNDATMASSFTIVNKGLKILLLP